MISKPPQDKGSPRLGRLGLTCVIFFTVSGGAYGLEPLVGSLDPGWAVALILITPLLWCLPIAWMVSELSSALPAEGGYYAWVREGLGSFWGFQEGWWTLCYTAIDMAIYPVLFVDYLAYFYPSVALPSSGSPSWRVFIFRWLIALAVILSAFVVNARGIRMVGRSSAVTTALVLAPFGVLTFIGLDHWSSLENAFSAIRYGLTRGHNAHFLALGLAVVLWNYSGWDNVSTFAAEVKHASRSYPAALAAAQILIVVAYLLPVLAGVGRTSSPALWSESAGWPEIARLVAGNWLAAAVAAMGVVSAWSMFNSQLLYVSRLPSAMALDGWFPSSLARISVSAGVPMASLGLACAVAGIAAALPFTKLVVIDILLYSAELLLEFLALIALRLKRPEMERPFRVPWGWPGVILVSVLPLGLAGVVAVATLEGGSVLRLGIIPVVILSGVVIYFARRGISRRPI
ncbi:MAG: APC family permease [Terriglobia bacterium]